ncbi:TonB-dependent receptor [Algoriphagus aquimarinus]|uniref:TonB-dependent Receptor Plug Domain n=1 Tax=Algoriphagus aquimarinus TaxID=237018 RepID=A0A1I0VXC9_9BACT|nr:TonB-dependent receptor [Algoriphagus aquimarinus]SFA80737.1 TonB-dependent Receptor Plug Domain [Algoriphagus aquimarinus]
MNPRLLLFITFILLQTQAFAQASLHGKVLDEKGVPLPGANILIKGSYDGATSGQDGSYRFETSATGSQVLVFKFLGFKTQELAITLDQNSLEIQQIKLIEEITEMNSVTISAGAMEASDEKKSVVLRPLDIVTTSGAMGDIVGALQTLPGTSTVGNDGRLFVRGGDASEVGIYIDGLRVGNAYGSSTANVPTRTRFNPNIFKGTFFSTGGYSAEYGQALSSALSLNTKDHSLRTQGDVSIMSVGGGYSQTLANDKHSISLTANYFDLKPYQNLVKQDFDWERAPNGWDVELSAQQKLKKGGLVKVLARTEAGGMELWQTQPGENGRGMYVNLHNKYSYAQSNWRNSYDNGWSLFGGLSVSSNKDDLIIDATPIKRKNLLSHAKFTAIKDFSDRVSMKVGTEYFIHNYSEKLQLENEERSFDEQETYFFTEWDWYLSKKLVLRGGLRAGNSQLAEQSWVDPRLSLAYQVSKFGQVSLASGQFHQLPIENFRAIDPTIGNSKAKHLILNYLFQKDGLMFRAETFYKSYDELIRFEGNPSNPTGLRNAGAGYARGVDFFLRDRNSIKNTDYWISYSFVDSKRSYNQYETEVQPNFAPKHNFSLVVKHFIPTLKSQLGTTFSFNDGYTFTDPNESGEMNSKTKSYQSLSFSWSYLPRPNLIIHFAVQNVLGRENIFGYSYASNPNEQGVFESLPTGQPAPRFLFLGIFLTLSKDKTANNLNNL